MRVSISIRVSITPDFVPATHRVITFDAFIDLLPEDTNFFGGIDADAHLILFDALYRDGNLITDHYSFPYASGQYQHDPSSSHSCEKFLEP